MKIGDILSVIGSGIDLKDHSTSNTEPDYNVEKGLFGKKDEIEALEAEVAALNAKSKKSEDTLMYVAIGVIAAFILGFIKFK